VPIGFSTVGLNRPLCKRSSLLPHVFFYVVHFLDLMRVWPIMVARVTRKAMLEANLEAIQNTSAIILAAILAEEPQM
jgi:hypothetical protein